LGDGNEEEDEDEGEAEVTPSLHSSSPENLLLLSDLFSRQVGISVGMHWLKCPQTGTGASSSPLPKFGLTLVSSKMQGVSDVLVVTGTTHLQGVS
jgi:hypothetical protein